MQLAIVRCASEKAEEQAHGVRLRESESFSNKSNLIEYQRKERMFRLQYLTDSGNTNKLTLN